jgi:beta-lactamase class A
VSGGTAPVTDSLSSRLNQAWDAEIGRTPGWVSIQLHGLDAAVAGRDATRPHYAASTIKLAVLGALLADRAAGTRTATDPVRVHSTFPSAVGGTFELLQADDQDDETWARMGEPIDLVDLAEAMITLSSNIATDLIAERLGLASVAEFLSAAELGTQLRLQRLIGDSAADSAGLTNSVTAAGLAELLAGLSDATLLSASDAELAVGILSRQQHRNLIPAGLPAGTWSASKSGWVPGVRHDVALVRPLSAPAYILAVCTTGVPDGEVAERLITTLSRVTCAEWSQWHESPK